MEGGPWNMTFSKVSRAPPCPGLPGVEAYTYSVLELGGGGGEEGVHRRLSM